MNSDARLATSRPTSCSETNRDVRILRRIYQSYAEVAVRYRLPIQLGTPTWRASRKWTSNVEGVNAAAVELLGTIARQIVGTRIILAGVIGPASDGYAADEALSTKDAFAYHREQADVLARSDVDLLYAPTFAAFSELYGVARAMAETGPPICVGAHAASRWHDARRNATGGNDRAHRC